MLTPACNKKPLVQIVVQVSEMMCCCRSRHQLSYQQAQDIADRRPGFAPGQVGELREMLDLLIGVTDTWRQRRLEVRFCENS